MNKEEMKLYTGTKTVKAMPMISDAYDNPVDACYTLILKLHELNLL